MLNFPSAHTVDKKIAAQDLSGRRLFAFARGAAQLSRQMTGLLDLLAVETLREHSGLTIKKPAR
jgi:hypothetical protein